jgi:Fe-S cluster assembly scaffold protein SufB
VNALDNMLAALSAVYADAAALADPRTAHVVVDENRVLSVQPLAGVALRAEGRDGRLTVELTVAQGARIEAPIHSCIGFLGARGAQRIEIALRLEREARATVLAHCLFPNAEAGSHFMRAGISLGAGAELRYFEGHYHGLAGGMSVRPHLAVRLAPGARYFSDFSLTQGTVGRLQIDQHVTALDDAVAEIKARVFGCGNDHIHIRDELVLAGRGARGLVKTRIALRGEARAEVVGIARGLAEGARGHMDCLELVRERAVARAEPIVEASHPLAKITHEAAVGTVDQQQLETLMAHGLDPEQAIDLIVTGILQ